MPCQSHCVEFLLSQSLTPRTCTRDCEGLPSGRGRIEKLLKEMDKNSRLMSHLAYLQMVSFKRLSLIVWVNVVLNRTVVVDDSD